MATKKMQGFWEEFRDYEFENVRQKCFNVLFFFLIK